MSDWFAAPGPEEQLVLELTRRAVSDDAAPLPSAASGLDWQLFLDVARRHGVVAFLPLVPEWQSRFDVPANVREDIAVDTDAVVARNLFLVGELLRLKRLFATEAIPVVPFKGPLFAARFYPNPFNRQSWDLDLLLQRRDILRGRDLLRANQFTREFNWSAARERRELRSNCEYNFDHALTGLHVELHWRFVQSYIAFGMGERSIRSRCVEVPFAGTTVRSIPPEEMLVIMCVHNGLKHRWDRLRTVSDIHRIIASTPGLDWDRVEYLSNRYHVSRAVSTGLIVSQEVMRTELPPVVLENTRRDSRATTLATHSMRQLFIRGASMTNAIEHTTHYFRSRERFRDRWPYLRHVVSAILRPSDKEEAMVPVPVWLRSLHYLVRPARLVWKYTFTLRRPADKRPTWRNIEW